MGGFFWIVLFRASGQWYKMRLILIGNSMSTPTTEKSTKTKQQKALPWSVVVLDDPVNLMAYVTMVFKRVFNYPQEKAETLMMQVHQQGRSIVWTGEREKAEFYVQQLHGWQLRATMEKVE